MSAAINAMPIHLVQEFTPGIYRCGATDGLGSDEILLVQCDDCLDPINTGRVRFGARPHIPPIMNEDEDGVFLFTDRHHGAGYTMEVVPQLSGNVEITIGNGITGRMFTLSHLDRADLIRALLHAFHYSPERGGPNGDIN